MKLNLGCGTDIREGWENLDIYSTDPRVQKINVNKLPYEDSSIDEILADDILEHFTRIAWKDVLTEWWRTLRPGGTITIRSPEMPVLCRELLTADTAEKWEEFNRKIFGGQGEGTSPGLGMFHFTGFSSAYLRNHMEKTFTAKHVVTTLNNYNFSLTMRK